MAVSNKMNRVFQLIIIFLFVFSIIFVVYIGSKPQRYSFKVGDVSEYDITAPRTATDSFETEKRADTAKNSVMPIYVRSESISDESLVNLANFFAVCNELRADNISEDGTYKDSYRSLSNSFKAEVLSSFAFELTDDEAFQLMTSSDTLVDYIEDKSTSTARLILMDIVDDVGLMDSIESLTSSISDTDETYYISNSALVSSILSNILIPNAVYDEDATSAALDYAYQSIKSNPVTIEKGTRIISLGEVITEQSYGVLSDLDLLERNTFDFSLLIGIILYMLVVFLVLALYLLRFESNLLKKPKDMLAIAISFVLPIIASVYLADVSALISTVFFTAVIIATYLGIQSGIVLSVIQVMIILPINKFEVEFVFVSIIGLFVCSVIAGQKSRKFNSASLILLTAIACLAASIGYNLVVRSSRTEILEAALWAIISSAVSVVAAIGSMPIFELISNTVSPVRLIDLSQPGNPLLKRLFLEAPGTSQHCMMAANLADSAADAIGADALLAKVGAYYHDIGKLENPMFFSENQQGGDNPHNQISPEESIEIIIAHPDQGVRLARKNRLPNSIVKIIQEHHGTTCQVFFYHKAKTLALQTGRPEPSIGDFRYKGDIPSSRESAVVMLADTCEAAIRSTGISNLDKAEELFRKLVKQKIEQDQLNLSGLSFNDIEKIIRAFLQVYAGFFHERVKYPDDADVR